MNPENSLKFLFILFVVGCGYESSWSQLPVAIDMAPIQENLEVLEAYNSRYGEVFVLGPHGIKFSIHELEPGLRGNTRTRFDDSGIYSAIVKISPDIVGTTQYQYTLAHELGHALGINGHFSSGLMEVHAPDSGELDEHFEGEFDSFMCYTYRRCR